MNSDIQVRLKRLAGLEDMAIAQHQPVMEALGQAGNEGKISGPWIK